jgi:hypothetical protein
MVELDGKWGLIDRTGAVMIPIRYDGMNYFSGNGFKVELNGNYGIVDENGTEILPVEYDKIDDPSTLGDLYRNFDRFAQGLNEKYGTVDEKGTDSI